MNKLRIACLILLGMALVLIPATTISASFQSLLLELPASDWWVVIHDQCDDTLHWINPSGEYTSIPRPQLPDEAEIMPCSPRSMHISQDGRYLIQVAPLITGRDGVGFFDLHTGEWLRVHETQIDEFAVLGGRYSSDEDQRIAIGFAKEITASPAWRVILFDMTTGLELETLRSDGSQIASFVGGEFLADALTLPYVLLLTPADSPDGTQIHIRFNPFEGDTDPLGAIVWYLEGAPGVEQALVSGPYTATDLDLLPNGHAIFAYEDAMSPIPEPSEDDLMPAVLTSAIGLLLPDTVGESPDPQPYFADGISRVYGGQWGADGRIVMFRRIVEDTHTMYWIRYGTATLLPLDQQVISAIGVPDGFVYATDESIYYVSEDVGSPIGPIFGDPMLSEGAAFVWASAFGNPSLALDMPLAEGSSVPTPLMPVIVTATLDAGGCRVASAAGGDINVRSGPGTIYPILGQMLGGSELPVIGYNGQWYAINFQGQQGWMAGWVSTLRGNCSTLAFVPAPPPPAATEIATTPPLATTAPTLPPVTGMPDLFVSEFSLTPATPVQGQPVEVRIGVYNQGTAAAVGSFQVAWYPGENYASPACNWDVDGMAAGGGRILTCTYAGYPSSYGSINTKVVVDTLNVISESNEGNNTYLQAISVNAPAPSLPDLYVSEFSLTPATPVQGQPVEVRVGVYNQGTAAAVGSFRVAWYPGENYASPACNWDVDGMAASGGRILTCTYAGYPSSYGSINTKVVVDTLNTIGESNESNNTYLQAISVSSP